MRWWYTYECAPSTETRGRRDDHDKGCGWTCTRSTKQEISESYKPQGASCPKCGKRQRLNAGMVKWWAVKEDAQYHATEQNRRFANPAPHSASEQQVSKGSEDVLSMPLRRVA